MAKQGRSDERRRLNEWLETIKPGAVIKELVTVYPGYGSVRGNLYYKVIEVKPVIKTKVLYIEEQIRSELGLARVGDVGKLDQESIVDLRPVEADEYREMLMLMFA